MGKTKKLAIEEAEIVEEQSKPQPPQPKTEDAFAIPPALQEALVKYLELRPISDSEAVMLHNAVKNALPMKVTINPA